MRLDYKKLKKNIPIKVRAGLKSFYDVLWSTELNDKNGKVFGTTTFHTQLIVLNKEQSDREAVLTFFHEYIHAINFEHEIGLTEAQVEKIEKCYPYIRNTIMELEGKK